MGKPKKVKPGQSVAFKGAVATVVEILGEPDHHDGWQYVKLSTHRGYVAVFTDHPHLHIP